MVDQDIRLNFLFDQLPVRGEFVRLTQTFQTIQSQKSHQREASVLLGQALASIALLNGISKHDGKLILQFQGNGALKLLSVHCTQDDQLRALIQTEQSLINDNTILQELNAGQLVLFYEPGKSGKQYQSIIEIVSPHIVKNMEHYFSQSEQIATRIWITQTENAVTAFMLQQLPDVTPEKQNQWEHVTTLAETLTDEELSTLSFQEILHRLYHEEDIRVFDPQPLRFGCLCSKAKMERAILSSGKAEIDRILQSHDSVDISCEYCGNEYCFDAVDISCLFGSNGTGACNAANPTKH